MLVDMPLPLFIASASAAWVWLGGAILTGWVASERQRSPLVWFVFGVVFTPLLALVALLAAPEGG